MPTRYDLTMEPDLDAETFTGEVAIAVEVHEAVDEVVLNADGLTITDAWIEVVGGSSRVDVTVTLDHETERVRLAAGGHIEPGAAVVHLRFAGQLNEKLTGFYRSTYEDETGVEQRMAVTQFEATSARKAFPCWDEPEFKAVFAVTLVVADGLTALSNAAAVDDELLPDGRRRVRFADTMKMSTYLVAFIVGPLELTAPVDSAGTPVRIAHARGKSDLTPFALESATFALDWFTSYYGIPYPGDKCDLVSVPDFAFGAMENLGCITFREVLLLVDPARATQPELQNVADVIHHELAHMWFGDLVTMKWWNGIWLNEAFATFMEMKCTDAFRPAWARWVAFGTARTAAFDIDSLASTRPIEFEVVSPEDAEGMFDVLTYEKGAAVLRMLEQYLGEDEFRDGIRHYLDTHRYGNTETTDLWDAIESSTGEPVRQIMDSWIFQGGYPIVHVELVGDRTLRLRQERFRYPVGGADGGNEQWSVPVLYRAVCGGETRHGRVLLQKPEQDIELDAPVDWVHLNTGGSGFYRAHYVGELRDRLLAHLGELEAIERYGVVDDAFAATLAGSVRASEFLALVRSFADDTDLSVWQRILGALSLLDRVVDDAHRAEFQAFVRGLAGPALRRMGVERADGETDRERQRRATLFELAGALGRDESIATAARDVHRAHLADPAGTDPAMVAASLAVIAETGTADDFDAFLERFRTEDNPQEQLRYLYALTRFHDRASFERLLALTLEEVRSQNAPFVLARALMNRDLGPVAWDFVRRNWDAIGERFPSSTIARMAEGVRTLLDPAVANDVLGFFAEHDVPQGAKTIAQHLERLQVNVAFRERDQRDLDTALA